MINLIVLYPQPKDEKQFVGDYGHHTNLLHEKMGIPKDAKPYKVTKFSSSEVKPPFYQMFTMPFENKATLDAAMASPEMQEVAADANRISTGGPIVVLIGEER